MGGSTKSSQDTQQSSQTAPWAPAQPMLQGILSALGGQLGNYQPTGTENQALGQLTTNAQSLPNFGPSASGMASSYMGGDPTGLLRPALNSFNNTLNPIASGSLDPTQTPGMGNVLSTIRNDVSNSVNGMFAGAGRDLSGLNQQALARGISQGEAQPLLNQYNQNVQNAVGAATGMYNAAGQTGSALTGNQAQGLNIAQMLPGLYSQGPMSVLAAQQMGRMLPLQNLGMLENLTVPIAGLGGQSQGQAHSQGQQSLPWWAPVQALRGLWG